MSSPSHLRKIFRDIRKKRMIEILASFIGGGWLLIEIVERLLVHHYHFPAGIIDLTVASILGAMAATLVWRWFSGREKRPRNLKIEVLLVPLILLATAAADTVIILGILGIPGKSLLVAAGALGLGIAWIVLKSLQWAAASPAGAVVSVPGSEAAVNLESPAKELQGEHVHSPPEKSIIVLPFTNISPEEGQDYFCDGMTEEIITDLSKIRDLLVISRSSAMTLKRTKLNIREIADKVNVRYVLEGSVRKAGDNLRITAQLIDAETDTHLWAEKYNGTLEDVFDIQEEVSRNIVNSLKMKLAPSEDYLLSERLLPSGSVYESYLKANAEIWRFTQGALEHAIKLLQDSLDKAGDNALLHATIAGAYWQYVNIGIYHDEYISRSEFHVKKALELDPKSSYAHAILGIIHRDFKGKIYGAIRHLEKALSINPNESMTLLFLSHTYAADIGRPEAAFPLLEKSKKIDPLNNFHYGLHGAWCLFENKYESAYEKFRRWYEVEPENPLMLCFYAMTLAHMNEIDRALMIIENLFNLAPDNAFSKLAQLLKYAILKEKTNAFQVMTPAFRRTCRRDMEWSYYAAVNFALLGDKTEALDWMNNAIEKGFMNYPALEKEPFLDNIRNEPRFKELMVRVKKEWEEFEV